jgi:hypothetical protein
MASDARIDDVADAGGDGAAAGTRARDVPQSSESGRLSAASTIAVARAKS